MRKQGSGNVNPTTSGSYQQIREQGEGSTTSTKSGLLPGTAPIAQIRSLPLHLSQIRSFGRSSGVEGKVNGHRSSYIINTTKVTLTQKRMTKKICFAMKTKKIKILK